MQEQISPLKPQAFVLWWTLPTIWCNVRGDQLYSIPNTTSPHLLVIFTFSATRMKMTMVLSCSAVIYLSTGIQDVRNRFVWEELQGSEFGRRTSFLYYNWSRAITNLLWIYLTNLFGYIFIGTHCYSKEWV